MPFVKNALLMLTCSVGLMALELPITSFKLDNGLKLLVVSDTTLPIVSARLYYFTGSMYEGPGTSGLSHMYEHMMFKGTKRLGTSDYAQEKPLMDQIDQLEDTIATKMAAGIPESDSTIQSLRGKVFALLEQQRAFIKKDEIWQLYQENGATDLNAWTSSDLVAYIVTLPSNKVELFANIEADRMQNVVLREFFSERDVVTEERRMRYENNPTNNYHQRLMSLFFVANPYRIPTIGWYSDIRNYTRVKLEKQISQYYRPDNAMIVLAGNIKPEDAHKLIKKYFNAIKNPETTPDPVVTREPAPLGITRMSVEGQANSRVDMFFHTPGYGDADLPALDVVESLLNGESGRLYKRLVLEEKLALDASAGNAYMINDGYFHIGVTLKSGASHEKVEALILEELAKLTTQEPSEKELLRIKNGIRKYFLSQLESMDSFSDQLAFFEKLGSWEDIKLFESKIGAVTSTTEVVKKHLNPAYRTVGYFISTEGATK